ncbi:flagellar motor switch phosphatase FliY [Desulfofundulus thermosubterraneus]|uniref:Flagellar motor switch protein FliN/FliY n=1 Tax=Desulfofundulus thermosubterraneus DSM 16057 TaxID=1121432 RepID=A0A1M6FUP9_9FIRM|nr:flagellar motor switch phosphatase FliY [Desulfofundulus thermosubterraneus]SHJ01415.1 flagellar motor switch protein FliN/FliY [Desulfofundulus thermosubterraneus DSM 16057]
MVSDNSQFLSQEEIDALLKAAAGEPAPEAADEVAATAAPALEVEVPAAAPGENPELAAGGPAGTSHAESEAPTTGCSPAVNLTPEERDALGEIGNISMGSAATTLSELLNQKVTITSPRVLTCTQEEFFSSFKVPYVIIQVEFKEGLKGFNVLIIQLKDAMVMADLMMGGDGTNVAEQISELELSAASEAMNQMIGTASTSLATIFRRTINISPPQTTVLEVSEGGVGYRLPTEDPIVVVSFKMTIGDLVDTEIMQIMSLETAKEEAAMLLGQLVAETTAPPPEPAAGEQEAAPKPEPQPAAARAEPPPASSGERRAFGTLSEEEQRKLELLLDIPLKVSVVLGRTRRPIKEVLNLTPGAIVELSSLVDEPVEVLVNGTLVARGEVVVVNENFGVRITSIISPEERVEQLGTRY